MRPAVAARRRRSDPRVLGFAMGTRKSTAAGLLALALIAAGCATTPVYRSPKPNKLWREIALESRPRHTAPVAVAPPIAVRAVDASLDAAESAAAPGGSAPQSDEFVPAPDEAGAVAPPAAAPEATAVETLPAELPPPPTPVAEDPTAQVPAPPVPAVPSGSAGDALLLLALLGAAVAPLLLGRRA
jgi:hypothetical protein